jgi:hypothetical protein
MRLRPCTHSPCCYPPARNFVRILVESAESRVVGGQRMADVVVEGNRKHVVQKLKEKVFVRPSSHLPGRGVSFLENTPESLAPY